MLAKLSSNFLSYAPECLTCKMYEFNGSLNIIQVLRAFNCEAHADHKLNNAMNNEDIFCVTFSSCQNTNPFWVYAYFTHFKRNAAIWLEKILKLKFSEFASTNLTIYFFNIYVLSFLLFRWRLHSRECIHVFKWESFISELSLQMCCAPMSSWKYAHT